MGVCPVQTNDETLRCLERLHVRAWPASETARIDGWLWRWSGGGSQRANSVSTTDFIGNDPADALDRVEARYHAKDSPSQVHTFDLGRPSGLPALLAARGYGMGETTWTMLATAPICGAPSGPAAEVAVANDPSAEWLELYLAAITESRRVVNRQILRRIPDPRAFFSVRSGGARDLHRVGCRRWWPRHRRVRRHPGRCTRPTWRRHRHARPHVLVRLTWGAHRGSAGCRAKPPGDRTLSPIGVPGGVHQSVLGETLAGGCPYADATQGLWCQGSPPKDC
jgi:hypothetical protein